VSNAVERPGRHPLIRGVAAVAAAVGLVAGAWWASAEPLDPTLPHQVTVGPSPGPAPMSRLNGSRNGRSGNPLPRAPKSLWRARVPGSIVDDVAIDPQGAVVVGSTTHLAQIDPRGRVAWSFRLGTASAATGPVISSNGSRVLVTSEAELLVVRQDGRVRTRRSLPVRKSSRIPALLPVETGGVAVAVDAELLLLEADGDVRARASAPGSVQTLLHRPAGLVVVTRDGAVLGWAPPSPLSEIGSLGGNPSGGAVLVSDDTLVSVVDSRRLVALDLLSGVRRLLVPEAKLSFDGPPAVAADRQTLVVSWDGLLLRHDRKGRETLRLALEPTDLTLDGGVPAARSGDGAPLLVGRDGRIGFARPGLDVGVVGPSSSVQTAAGAACVTPASLVPAGPGRMVLACRSGIVWLVGS